MNAPRRIQVLPGFALTLGISLLFITLVLLLPLTGLALNIADLSRQEILHAVSEPRVVASYRITLYTAALASLFNGIIGLLLAWVLARYRFPGRTVLDALIDLPFALPTAVAGITLATLFAENGWYGNLLNLVNIKVAFAPAGIVIAMIFTSLPFVVRSVQPVLETLPAATEEAAATLGATPQQTFTRIIFPMLLPAWGTGVALSFARSLGEFGAVIFIAGNQPYVGEVTSLIIFGKLQEFDLPAAAAIAAVVLLFSLLLLLAINLWQLWFYLKYRGKKS